jgi:GH24 family phage-related lysozyme (muramidase)
MKHPRLLIAALSLSAAAFGGLVVKEGFTSQAVIPIPGDRPTVGFGSTFNDQGQPVRMGDTITAPQAVLRSLAHIAKDETALKRCVTAPLSQVEYDILVGFSYWRGAGGTCRSEIVRHINAGRYADACAAYLSLDGRKAAGKDCSISSNKCRGVWLRAQERHQKCMAAQ